MFLKLLESRRARHFAGGALAASVAIHLGLGGAAVRNPSADGEDGPEPISIRYLLPPPRPQIDPVEHIDWAMIGPGAPGWEDGTAAHDAALPTGGGNARPEATRATEVPVLTADAFQPSMTYQDYEVDSAATRDPASGGPEYPDSLRVRGVQGAVLVEFAVDTTGHADASTFTVVEATHPEFARAVRDALPRMLFTPAVSRGRRVRQLVRLPMKFELLVETAHQGTA
jgi:TonB family protein